MDQPNQTGQLILSEHLSFRKSTQRWSFLKVILAIASLILFFSLIYLASIFYHKQIAQRPIQSIIQSPEVKTQVLGTETQVEKPVSPVRLKIPSINVDATVQYVGLTPQGAMDVPSSTVDVGWYKLGPRPGEQGNAVIAGHFNGENGKKGVFNDLEKLKPGDKIFITNDQGADLTFVVRERRTYKPGYAEEVFFANDKGTHLNLITCDGVWDTAKKTYTKRLVVFADIVH